MRRGAVVALSFLAALGRPAAAGDALTVEEAAAVAASAVRDGDAKAVEGLARNDVPDPWAVVDLLLSRGEKAVAEAVAKAGGGPDLERLPAYVAAAKEGADDRATRAALREAEAAAASGEGEKALALLGTATAREGTVLAVLLARGKARALGAAGKHEEASRAHEAAAVAAEGLGWVAEASQAHLDAGSQAYGRDFPRALAAWAKARALFERRGKPEGVAGLYFNCALAHRQVGDWEKALGCAQRALEMRREIGDDAMIAVSTRQIGALHQDRGDLGKALASYEEALRIQREAGLDGDAAATQVEIGGILVRRGQLARAREVLEEVVATLRAAAAPSALAPALQMLAYVLHALGDSPRALALYADVRRIYADLDDRPAVVGVLADLGLVHRERGDVPKALEAHQEALELARRTGVAWLEGAALQALGADHLALGSYAKALGLAKQAEQIFERVRDPARVALALFDAARSHRLLGQFQVATVLLERARTLLEATGDRVNLARVRQELGYVAYSLGDHATALERQREALKEYEAVGMPGAAAVTHTNVGVIQVAREEYDAAVEAYRTAIGIFEDVGDRANLANALVRLAEAYQRSGRPERALELLERSRRLHDEMKDRVAEAFASLVLAACRRSLGKPQEALAEYGKAEQKANRLSANDLIVEALIGTARTRLDLKEPRAALDAAKRAVPLAEGLARGQAEEQGASARAQFAELYDVGARAAADLADVEEAAFFLEAGRAGTLLESLGGRELLQTVSLSAARREAEAAARGEEAAAFRAYVDALEAGERPAILERRDALDAARDRLKEAAEASQREAKAAAGLLVSRPAPLDEMRGWLGPEEALVLYALPKEEAIALVVTAEGGRIVRLGPTSRVDEACEGLRPSDRSRDPAEAAKALAALVWEPLGLDEKTTRVLVSPDGALTFVPFAVFAGERTVAYVPSGTTFGTLREDLVRAKPDAEVLALGDPVYPAALGGAGGASGTQNPVSAAYERGGVRLVPLPGTREEAKAIGDVHLLGPDATEAGFRKVVESRPRWRAVHFACHGLLDPERPTLSSLALTAQGGDDGFLLGVDVAAMRIRTDLAVLSACETGRGRLFRGEGVIGLVRAFMLAGAPRVVVSLWRVDDQATRALMTEFYARWKKGTPTARALREAQHEVRKQAKWSHPYYWAAWVLWGLPT
jgi:tetratricopeptide (TPR) repeat protein